MMKVIFLDIDGVMNSEQSCIYAAERLKWRGVKSCDHYFPDEAREALKTIVENTGAKLVISSSWRIGRNLEELREELTTFGVFGDITDMTPRGQNGIRGREIQAWLDQHPEVTSFVILDDDSDMEHLMPRLVKTSWKTGLLMGHVDIVIEMLNE